MIQYNFLEWIREQLAQNNIRHTTFHDWEKVNKLELEEGEKHNKVRHKIKTKEEYFQALDAMSM